MTEGLAPLTFGNTPGLWAPMRFLVAAPVFGMLAAGLLFFSAGSGFPARWTPTLLASTHLWTLGFVTMTMLGALQQILPVLLGVMLPRREPFALILFVLLGAGSLTLAAAFARHSPTLFTAALAILPPTLILSAAGLALAIFPTTQARATARIIQAALAGLLATASLGGWLAAGHASDAIPLTRWLTPYHAAWGIVGWVLMLVIGVSRQVLPMFLTTPRYPRRASLAMAFLLVALLAAGTLAPWPWLDALALSLLYLTVLGFAIITHALLWRRRRRQRDVAHWFWHLGMLCLGLGATVAVAAWRGFRPGNADPALIAGVLLLVGFAGSVINGMLYKIAPFLVWLHIRLPAILGQTPPGVKLVSPNIHEAIPAPSQMVQFGFHLAAILLLVGANVFSALARPAAGALFIAQLLLLANLLRAVGVHKKFVGVTVAA